MRALALCLTLLGITFSSPAHSQSTGLGDLIEGILGEIPPPSQTPIFGQSEIENIPVTLRLSGEDSFNAPLNDAMLILSAYAPNDPSGKAAKPKLLGQTRLALTGLELPLQLVIATAEPATRDLPYARITAQVLDINDNVLLFTQRDGLYRGADEAVLTLVSELLGQSAKTAPQPLSGLELIKGEVKLGDPSTIPLGSKLTVQLMETTLAGGNSRTIAAEQIIELGQNQNIIPFELERGLYEGSENMPLSLTAWITDWAGRKTHVLRAPIGYNGPDIDYKLRLDTLAQGAQTQRGRNLNPDLMAKAQIYGDAVFDPQHGIPSGARLKATLSRTIGAFGEDRTLATQTIIMAPNTGRIPFSLLVDSTEFDPLIPAPSLNLQIVDSYDRVYFESGPVAAREDKQDIKLYPRR